MNRACTASQIAAIAAAAAMLPASAAAAPARQVASIRAADASQGLISDISSDGTQLLIAQRSQPIVTADKPVNLWTVNTSAGVVRQLASVRRGPYSQSPDGQWAGWTEGKGCRSNVMVARTDGSHPPRTIALPGRYSRLPVDTISVTDGGGVIIRAVRCNPDRYFVAGSDPRAVLVAQPGTADVATVVDSGSDFTKWPVSQDGRVFAACSRHHTGGSRWLATVTVIGPQPDPSGNITSHRAVVNYNDRKFGPVCQVSDAGTAVMTAVGLRGDLTRRHIPLGDSRIVGATAGPGGAHQFRFGWGVLVGGVGSASPDGTRALTLIFGRRGVQSRLLDLRAGKAGKLKRTPIEQGFAPIDTAGTGTQADTPTDLPWDPYGPVVPLFNYGRRAGELTFFNARSGHHTPKLKVGTPPRTTLRACFLPSRRVLLMSTSLKFDRTDPQQIIRLFITNPERTRAVQLDTSALGHVSSMICTATSRGEMLYAAADNGNVYEVAAEAAQLDPTIVPAAPAAPIP